MTKELSGENGLFHGFYLLKNLLVGIVATAILLFLSAMVLTCVPVSEQAEEAVVLAITLFCIAWNGFRAARHTGRRGLFSGGVSGLLYMAVLCLAGLLMFGNAAWDGKTALSLCLGIGCGAVGGIVGVNTKQRRR